MATWDALYTQQYDSNLRLASQQQESRLLRTVTIDRMAGLNKYFEKILKLGTPTARASRFQMINLQDTPFERRMLTPTSYDDVRGVDSLDRLRSTVEDPSSKIMLEQTFEFNVLVDQTIINAAVGSAFVQATVNGAPTSVSLPSSQQIPIGYDEPGTGQSGNTGFTVGKLKYGKTLLTSQEAIRPGEELFCILDSAQIAQLLRDPQVTNMFYNESRPLVSGDIAQFLGATFIRSELIPSTATAGSPFSGTSTALLYPSSAMEFAWLEAIHGRVDYLPERRGEVYGLKALGSFGSTRMFEERVVTMTTDNTV
jgi:hypothetical protein